MKNHAQLSINYEVPQKLAFLRNRVTTVIIPRRTTACTLHYQTIGAEVTSDEMLHDCLLNC
jgi:hypothetical protein